MPKQQKAKSPTRVMFVFRKIRVRSWDASTFLSAKDASSQLHSYVQASETQWLGTIQQDPRHGTRQAVSNSHFDPLVGSRDDFHSSLGGRPHTHRTPASSDVRECLSMLIVHRCALAL
jgi:hypothetical protein